MPQRSGTVTTTLIIGDTPEPSSDGQLVTFTAVVSASSAAPTDGRVVFVASSGESCSATTTVSSSASAATFACELQFTTNGTSSVITEYLGSVVGAYSASAPEPHTSNLSRLFANEFETP